MTFQFSLLTSLIPLIISLGIISIGAALILKKYIFPGGILLTFGALFGIIFGPTLFMDSVEVSESGIEQTTGFWFSPNVKGIKFTDLIEVTLTTELNRNNRPAEIWYAKYSTGEVIRVDPGDLWDLNTREIVEYMIQSGIRVVADENA